MQTNCSHQISYFSLLLAVVFVAMVTPLFAQQDVSADVTAVVVVSDLDAPTDFSVTADGEVVFIAEQGAQQIRRVQGDSNEVIVDGIETPSITADSISVEAISNHKVLVGVSGDPTYNSPLRLFDIAVKKLPLDFNDQFVKRTREFERSLKRTKGLNVLDFFHQQKGLTMICKSGEAAATLCDIYFKNENLERLDIMFIAETANLSTLAVEQVGGYLVAVSQDMPTRILFFQAEGTLMQSFEIDIENIISMSFSPKHNRLYALVGNADNVPNDLTGAGIYEILTDGDACKSRFVIAIQRPQKLKFDAQGNAWVLCGSDAGSRLGLLKKINSLDVNPAVLKTKEETSSEN